MKTHLLQYPLVVTVKIQIPEWYNMDIIVLENWSPKFVAHLVSYFMLKKVIVGGVQVLKLEIEFSN